MTEILGFRRNLEDVPEIPVSRAVCELFFLLSLLKSCLWSRSCSNSISASYGFPELRELQLNLCSGRGRAGSRPFIPEELSSAAAYKYTTAAWHSRGGTAMLPCGLGRPGAGFLQSQAGRVKGSLRSSVEPLTSLYSSRLSRKPSRTHPSTILHSSLHFSDETSSTPDFKSLTPPRTRARKPPTDQGKTSTSTPRQTLSRDYTKEASRAGKGDSIWWKS